MLVDGNGELHSTELLDVLSDMNVGWRDKPVALSIVQARLVGLAHFTVGFIFTFAPFVIASTTGKFA